MTSRKTFRYHKQWQPSEVTNTHKHVKLTNKTNSFNVPMIRINRTILKYRILHVAEIDCHCTHVYWKIRHLNKTKMLSTENPQNWITVLMPIDVLNYKAYMYINNKNWIRLQLIERHTTYTKLMNILNSQSFSINVPWKHMSTLTNNK